MRVTLFHRSRGQVDTGLAADEEMIKWYESFLLSVLIWKRNIGNKNSHNSIIKKAHTWIHNSLRK